MSGKETCDRICAIASALLIVAMLLCLEVSFRSLERRIEALEASQAEAKR
jgi:hypothetical protein